MKTDIKSRKLNLFLAIAMLFGSVVGMGIFFKNQSIAKITDYNGWSIFLTWFLGGVIALFMAISFFEISSTKTRQIHGLSSWAEKYVGKRFAYLVRFSFPIFYSGMMTTVFGVVVSESFFQMLVQDNILKAQPSIYVHVLIGLAVTTILIIGNFVSIFVTSWVMTISTFIKLIPLGCGIIGGLALFSTNNLTSNGVQSVPTGVNWFAHPNGEFSFNKIFMALPVVIFAFDGFLNTSQLPSNVKGGQRSISLSIIVTMIAIVIIYNLLAISQIVHGAPLISDLMNAIFGEKAGRIWGIIMWFFIMWSILGVQNSLAMAFVHSLIQGVKSETFFGSATLLNKIDARKTTFVYCLIICAFWFLIILLPAMILNSDEIIGSVTTNTSLIFFVLYGIIIFAYMLKRKDAHTKKINTFFFYTFSSICVVCIFLITSYELIFGMTVNSIQHALDVANRGIIVSKNNFTRLDDFIIYLLSLFVVFILPWINAFVTILFEGVNVVKDTQGEHFSTLEWEENFVATETIEIDVYSE